MKEKSRSEIIFSYRSAQELVAHHALREIRRRQRESEAIDKRLVLLAAKSQTFQNIINAFGKAS